MADRSKPNERHDLMDRVRDWKPGDRAVVNGARAIRADDNMSWWTTSGRLSDPNVAHIRPLVGINPENREDVARIYPPNWVRENGQVDFLQEHLRGVANPTPRIEEPTGLGAVVESDEGSVWVRTDTTTSNRWIRSAFGDRVKWSDIPTPVRVLSEGVPA